MLVVKQHVIKNDKKTKENYIRDIKVNCNGFDISYGSQRQAMKFTTRNIAITVAQDLLRYGNFFAVEVDG